MRKRTFKTLLMTVLTVLCCGFVMNLGQQRNVQAADNTFEMTQGGSIRIKEPYGLRFQVKMNAAVAEKADKVGMLIFPADYLVDNGIYGDVYYGSVQEIALNHRIDLDLTEKLYEKEGYWYGNGAIVNIKEKNMSREFVGIAYYEMDGETVWADTSKLADTTRSAAQIALLTHADKTHSYSTEATTVLLNYVDRLKAADVEEGAPTRFQVRGYAADNGLRFYVEQYVNTVVDTGDELTEQTHLEVEILQENISGGNSSTDYKFGLDDTYESDDLSNVKNVINEATFTDRGTSFEGYRYKITYEIFIEFTNSVDNPCAYVQFKHYLPEETEDGLGYVYKKYTNEDGTCYYWQDKCNSFEVSPLGIVAKELYDYNSDLFYQNLGTVQAADPSVITVGDTFYLYATDASEGYNCTSIRVWSSKNLSDWKEVGKAFVPAEDAWAVDRLWAPEVIAVDGQYYMYYSGYNSTTEVMGIGVAVSNSPTGPFHEIEGNGYSRTEQPIDFGFPAIDPNPFIDDDGNVYLYVAQDQVNNVSSIYGCKLGSDMVTVEEGSITTEALVVPQNSDEATETSKKWNEAPHMYKHNDTYYLVFSSGYYQFKNYCLGIATSSEPLSGFKRINYNPVLYALDTWKHVSGTGHCSFFPSPDGTEIWMAYHSHTDTIKGGVQRKISFDKVTFDIDDRLVVSGPSVTPQVLPSGASDYGNVASEATVTATSSENVSRLTDGIVNYRTGTNNVRVTRYEYSSEGNNTINFTFEEARKIKGIMIYDGADLTKGGQKVDVMIGENPYEMTLDSSTIPGTASILEIDETEASTVTLTFTESVNLSEVVILAEKTRSSELSKIELTTNYFTEAEDDVYTLAMNSAGEGGVDDVKQNDSIIREAYYSIKGNITLDTNADWTQARILVSSDPNNEHIIALERVDGINYQIFAMSKNNENIWNDWRLVSHSAINGSRNLIDFEVIANGRQIYFLIDDEICYTSNRVSMTESTVKFSCAINNQVEGGTATTTVKNLDGQIFENKQAVEDYLRTKSEKVYESPLQARIDEHYNDYVTNNGCTGKGGTLLLGHSHIDRLWWSEWETQTGLTNYVNGYNVGIGGSTTFDWLHGYGKLVKPFAADRFVISLGENDINVWGADGAEVVERLAELFNKIHTDFPEAEIYYIYSLPAQTKYVNGKWLNSKYAALVKGEKDLVESLEYVEGISMFDLLVDADSQNVKTELYRTNDIHLNAAGYKVWSERLYDLIFYDLSVKGENFGVTKAGDTYYITTGGINLENDKGANPTIDVLGGGTSYAYLNDTFTNKLYFETEITVSEVLNNDGFPKFGLMLNGKTEMVKFYVDMTPEMTADSVGVVHQKTSQNDDWGNAVSAKVPGMKFTGDDTIKLAVARDGRDYYFYVNDKLVLWKNGALFNGDEMSAVGIFSFNSVLTASDYQIYKDADAENYITKAQEDAARFFGDANGLQTSEGVDLSKDTGASTGTVSVDEDGDRYIYAKDFYDAEYYFETKIHVNDVLDTEDYPKFGLFAQDGTERVHFYVNMMKDKTSDKVGRVHNYEWGSEVEVTVNGMSFADEGEYVTLGLLKDGKTLHFYVNGGYVQSYESNFTGNSTVGAFSFKTSMDLKEYYIDQTEETMTAKRELATTNMLSLLSEGSLQTANEGVKIWTDRDYVFTSLPVALAGREFVQGPIAQGVSVNVKKNGYLYVITPVAGAVNSCAKILDGYNFSRLDVAMWRFCDASNNNVCVYEKRVESGDKYTLDRWAIVFTSDKPLNFTTNNYITEDDSQLAVLRSVDGYEVHNMTLGAKVFSDRTYTFSDMPYGLAGKNYILNNYDDTEQSAVATREGYVYMYTNTTVANALEGLKQQGFEVVSSDAVHLFSAGTFNQRGFSLLKKHVRADEVVTWSQWAIPIFSGDSQSSNNVIDNIAKLEPIGTSEAAKLTAGARLYNDRLYYLTESLPEELDGMSYIYDSIAGGYAKVTEAGKVYMMIPVMATIYEELVASVEADGWQLTPYRNFRLSPGLEYSCLLYEKEFEVGAEIHYGKYNLLIYGTISEEDYYVLPSVSEPAQIIKNPQGELSSKEQSWLGCPTIERSSEGRLWASWFTGGARELGTGNYATISYSDNDGVTWHHASYVVRHPNTAVQVTKPEFWTDPDGNLWLFWVQHTGTGNFDGKMGVWASVCKNPDAENPTWSEPRRLSDGYLRSKPIILQSGEWIYSAFDWMSPHETAIYVSADKGQTWTLRGKAECLDASSGKNNLDDPVLVEKKNGTLWLVIRTDDGPYESFSKDGGATWTHAVKSSIEGPPTRMTIDRLASGNLLMVYHDASSRTNLTAYLSTDDGETWSHKLLLDERVGVTYPDVIQKSDGTIYVIYDRYRTLDKEILMATFTEQDIINGFFGEDAQQKVLVNDDGK